MTSLDDITSIAASEHHLAVVSTLRADSTIQASVVNAGVLAHPATGRPSLAFVTYGRVKLANLRARPQVTVTFRHGWQWATVEGRAQVAGPDDPKPWLADAVLEKSSEGAGRRFHSCAPRSVRCQPRSGPNRGANLLISST